MRTRRNDDNLEVVSISEEEENGSLVKLNNASNKLEGTQYSIIDAAIKSPDTSFVLQPVREVQRPNKLLRSRAPLNQQKCKDSNNTKIVLTLPEASPLNSNETDANLLEHETTLSIVPLHRKAQNEYDNLPPLNRIAGIKSSQEDDTSVSAAISSVTQSAVTSFIHPVTSFEPELVLSPAKLGQ